MPVQARSLLITAPNQVTTGSAELPDPGPGEVLIETIYSVISPGAELRVLAGKQAGVDRWPVIPGYSLVGRVVATGSGTTLVQGTPVFCTGTLRADKRLAWGGHISHAIVPEPDAYVVPSGVDILNAVMAKLAAIAYRGLRQSQPLPHEKVAVIGLGPVGQLSARLHSLTGARVVAADLSKSRVELARRASVEAIIPQSGLIAAYADVFPQGADIIVDATGIGPVLVQAFELAKDVPWDDALNPGARVIVQGSYPEMFNVPYDMAFQHSTTIHVPRDHQPRDIRAVLDLMRRGKLHARDLISDIRPPDDVARTYADLRTNKGPLLTVAFDWRES